MIDGRQRDDLARTMRQLDRMLAAGAVAGVDPDDAEALDARFDGGGEDM